ncbi:unnamed protein product [Didymodactylos carnosus]|uniref:Aquaporin n=1 Tax=Didymodactylos carnosus TaxID=1234261 RepID=A0A8S2EKC3_9BILA|nr:unnamed protein product [Didymodactylos carnosus]CAF3979183.1 unnamed protein product [Didymodactylos carnosus]
MASATQPLITDQDDNVNGNMSKYSTIQNTHPSAVSDEMIGGEDEDRKSPEARRARWLLAIRAMCGELLCTTLFFTTLFASLGSTIRNKVDPSIQAFFTALSSGLIAVALVYAFSGISGAHFNPAITFATYVTRKTSHRRFIGYIVAQLIGSILAMCVVWLIFPDPSDLYTKIAVIPPSTDLARVFAMEVFLTFTFTYVAFTVGYEEAQVEKKLATSSTNVQTVQNSKGLALFVSTPQARTGFAPFAIGFTIFCMILIGSSVSGGAFNPCRLFGPAIFSNRWDY